MSTLGPIGAAAVLFDMDGTLVDSTLVVETLWKEYAARHGFDSAAILAFSHGRVSQDTARKFLPPGGDVATIVDSHLREELSRLDGIREIPGARDLMLQLEGGRVAVVTSAPESLARARLEAAGVPIPSVVVTSECVEHGKPDPEGYLLAARRLGVPPADCLVVEDAEAGIQAGLRAGARVLVVGSHESATTADLPRVPDLTGVRATVAPDGAIRLSFV